MTTVQLPLQHTCRHAKTEYRSPQRSETSATRSKRKPLKTHEPLSFFSIFLSTHLLVTLVFLFLNRTSKMFSDLGVRKFCLLGNLYNAQQSEKRQLPTLIKMIFALIAGLPAKIVFLGFSISIYFLQF